ncbi:MAG: hypothetical protein QOI29_4441 [Mycobacterium sp.]|jgi:hypothetical protein|nr:hypothetical protein [Mycobacterium sp.]
MPSDYAQLFETLYGHNSVVAVMAFRTLAAKSQIDVPSLRAALGQVYLALLQRGPIDENALFSELSTIIGATSAPEELRPIAIAIAATRLLHPKLAHATIFGSEGFDRLAE